MLAYYYDGGIDCNSKIWKKRGEMYASEIPLPDARSMHIDASNTMADSKFSTDGLLRLRMRPMLLESLISRNGAM